MEQLLQALHDLNFSVTEHPAEWSDKALAEITNLAQSVRGAGSRLVGHLRRLDPESYVKTFVPLDGAS